MNSTWEQLHNPGFKVIEFDHFKMNDENPKEKGNIRDYANVSQLICLANLENLNAVFIDEGLSHPARLEKLNKIAISQMRILVEDRGVKKLRSGKDGE